MLQQVLCVSASFFYVDKMESVFVFFSPCRSFLRGLLHRILKAQGQLMNTKMQTQLDVFIKDVNVLDNSSSSNLRCPA